jgi:predicted aldo/keto reductase-like oxidoreductase
LILRAVQAGVNYFDTAYIYPNSEATLGAILHKNGLREKVYIATKLPHQKCKNYNDFEKYFSEQLRRLKTDYIDYYLIHNISDLDTWRRLCDMGIKEWISAKKEQGQIGHIGFSFHGANRGFMELLEAYDWEFCLIQYNYLDENYQAGRSGLMKAHEKGLTVFIMEPLRGGKLATGLPSNAVEMFKRLNAEYSVASWAFRWLWNQPEVSVVLSGMNDMAQLEDNLKTAENAKAGMLTQDEIAVYGPVIAALNQTSKISCTGCNYCMPCPHGINIPDSITAYNTSFSMGFITGFFQYLISTGAHKSKKHPTARDCVKCGLCEEKCPQDIEIGKALEAVSRRMEPFWFGPLTRLIQLFNG